MRSASYDRPTNGRLVVRLENGEEWDATDADVAKFGFVDPHAAYQRLCDWMRTSLESHDVENADDLTETGLNPFRYAAECALLYPHMPGARSAWQLAKLARVDVEDGMPKGLGNE